MADLHIAVLAGTTRIQRKSIMAAKFVVEIGKTIPGISVELIDPNDFHFEGDGDDPEGKDPRYTAITEKADGFFIVTPEYNHSFPGSLKRMLDSELKNYNHKPVAIAGVSSGNWGGVRVVEALTVTVRAMGLVVTSFSTYFPKINDVFDDNGQPKDQIFVQNVKKAYAELIWMAETLKHGRDNIKPTEL